MKLAMRLATEIGILIVINKSMVFSLICTRKIDVGKFYRIISHCRESEDDPERLWCICQQPHNNRFMICCDSCLDWYHGKCVGITKKMGKEMEEAGNEWRCPTCKKKDKVDTVSAKSKNELEQKLEAKLQKEKDKQSRQENKLALKGVAVRKKQQGTGSKKRPGSAMSNDGKEEKVALNQS